MENATSFPQRLTGFDANRTRCPTRIIADCRERDAGVLHALSDMPEVEVQVAHLTCGDYVVDDLFVFERKTLVDLTASIKDARLFRQACRLAGDSRRAAFILEGTAIDLGQSAMRREAIQGALVTITLMLGLPVLRSRNASETARLMIYAARQARAWSSGAIARRVRRPKGKRRAQLQMLQGLPGVGPGRAGKLLDVFGSVEAVLMAGHDELRSVAGIGATTADAIRWIVSESCASYVVKTLAADSGRGHHEH
jgi:DNA excision repair protein ERCC-4